MLFQEFSLFKDLWYVEFRPMNENQVHAFSNCKLICAKFSNKMLSPLADELCP